MTGLESDMMKIKRTENVSDVEQSRNSDLAEVLLEDMDGVNGKGRQSEAVLHHRSWVMFVNRLSFYSVIDTCARKGGG